jgi:hypothetical protein
MTETYAHQMYKDTRYQYMDKKNVKATMHSWGFPYIMHSNNLIKPLLSKIKRRILDQALHEENCDTVHHKLDVLPINL